MVSPEPTDSPEALAAQLRGRDTACPACGYNLRDLTTAACPECGRRLTLEMLRHAAAISTSLRRAIGMAKMGLAIGVAITGIHLIAIFRHLAGPRPFLAAPAKTALAAIVGAIGVVAAMVLLKYLIETRPRENWWTAWAIAACCWLGSLACLVITGVQ